MAYWVHEIEEYLGGSDAARHSFGKPVDYEGHGEYMASSLSDTNNVHLRTIHIGLQPVCNNPEKHSMLPTSKKLNLITFDDNWYTVPDAWTRTKDARGRWHTPLSHARPHRSLGGVMESLLGRTEGETTECTICQSKYGKSYQVTWEKKPATSRVPLVLEFKVDPDQKLHAEERLEFAGMTYDLVAIVFGNGRHFKCNMLLRNLWYHYDDMGMPSKAPAQLPAGNVPRIPRMVRAQKRLSPPPPFGGFRPISYRYVRVGAAQVDPAVLSNDSILPNDLQFNSMWRLMH
jgi:hypothetical protein